MANPTALDRYKGDYTDTHHGREVEKHLFRIRDRLDRIYWAILLCTALLVALRLF